MEFMPDHAPLAVLTFLGTVALLGLLALMVILAVWTRRKWIGIGSATVAAALVCGYVLALLGVSLTGHEKTLIPGEWKYFCEIDCHIAYSIAAVKSGAATPQDPVNQTPASGQFVFVQLNVWFDPRTISPHRGNGPLMTSPRRIVLVDDTGREYPRSPGGEAVAVRALGPSAPLEQPLRPGESFTTNLAFDAPRDAKGLRLLVTDSPDDWFSRVIIGHEDSFLHPKIYLALTSPRESRPSAAFSKWQ
jgi:hypothetical protein